MILLIIVSLCYSQLFSLSPFKCYDKFVIKNAKGKYLTYPGGRIYEGHSYNMVFREKEKKYDYQTFSIYDGQLIGCDIIRQYISKYHAIGIMPNGKFILHYLHTDYNKKITYRLYNIIEAAKNYTVIPVAPFVEIAWNTNNYVDNNTWYMRAIHFRPNRYNKEMTFAEWPAYTVPYHLDSTMYEIIFNIDDKYYYFDTLVKYPGRFTHDTSNSAKSRIIRTLKDIEITKVNEIIVDGVVFKRRRYNVLSSNSTAIKDFKICFMDCVPKKYDITAGIDSIPYNKFQQSDYVFDVTDVFCAGSILETYAFHWMVRTSGINPEQIIMRVPPSYKYIKFYNHAFNKY